MALVLRMNRCASSSLARPQNQLSEKLKSAPSSPVAGDKSCKFRALRIPCFSQTGGVA